MRLLFFLLALVALSLAARKGDRKHGKYMKEMGKEHKKMMLCLKDCNKCMKDTADPEEDDDALDCYNDHLECMKDVNFGSKLKKMPGRMEKMMKMFPKLGQFKKCFGDLESCAAGANDNEVVGCAETMRNCMSNGQPEKIEDLKLLPNHVQKVIQKYLRCISESGGKISKCVRNHISSVKRMSYGYQMSACINKIFFCQNKVDSDASVCCNEFMGCKNAITEDEPKELTEKEKKHPMAMKALAMQKCLVKFEEQHGKVPDDVCISDFSNCIIKVEMPMVPGPMLKHGYCIQNLQKCKPGNADDAAVCMNDYHTCLGSMMHKAEKMDDEDDDDK